MSCAKSELCIFDKAPPQVVIENGSFEEIYPINSITGPDENDVEFVIQGSESHYLDLNDTLLSIQLKVVDENGKALAKDANVYPSNYLLHSLFKDVILKLNGTQIEGGNNTYAQKAVFENILNYSQDTTKTFLTSVGYYQTVVERKSLIAESKTVDLCGSLLLDFFNQPKYLIPGVNVHLRLQRNSSEFCLHGKGKIVFKQAKLLVRRVKVVPSVLTGHSIGLKRQNAVYPIRKTRLMKYSLGEGLMDFYKDQLFGDMRLPKFVLVTFQKTAALNGSFDEESTEFTNADVGNISISRNSDYKETYNVNFAANEYMTAYVTSIIRNMGLLNKNMNNGITSLKFRNSTPFFTFVLAPDFDIDQKQIAQQGNLRLDIKFTKALTVPINILVYGVFDSEVQISGSHEITI